MSTATESGASKRVHQIVLVVSASHCEYRASYSSVRNRVNAKHRPEPTFHSPNANPIEVTRSPLEPRKRLNSQLDESTPQTKPQHSTTMNSSPYSNNDQHHFHYVSNSSSSNMAMDTNSLCSSDFTASDMSGMSNDTFEITRRGRQDVMMMEGRMQLDRNYLNRYSGTHPADVSFPGGNFSGQPRWSSGSSLRKRRVSFAGQKIINEGAQEVITVEEMEIRWWSQDDLDNIKKAAKEMSLKLRKLAKEKGCYVEVAHKKTTLMLTNSFQELVKMSASSPDQDLRHWCVRSDGRRGLERFACKEYGNTRKDDVIGTRMAVFQEQDKQRKARKYIPEAMAKVSKAHSRRSRTFSLFMGEADAQTATRNLERTTSSSSSKRVKSSQQSPNQPKQKQQRVRQPAATSRGFQVEAPVLTSSA